MELNIDLKLGKNKKDKQDALPTLIVNPEDTVSNLKKKIISTFNLSKLNPNRLGMSFINNNTNKKTSLSSNTKSLVSLNMTPGDTVIVKDLGIQVSWRWVYVVEYLGPLFIIALFFSLNNHFNNSNIRSVLFIMSTFHYLKRLFESAFLHEFSRPTMPLANLFINCGYYWGVYGFFVGFTLFYSNSNIESHFLGSLRYVFAFLFFVCEIQNLKCHIILRELKAKNNGEKGIPSGEGFDLVSCANYFWEVMSWLFFSLCANHYSAYTFTILGLVIMSKWANERHVNYKKTFGDKYPKNRKRIIPFIY